MARTISQLSAGTVVYVDETVSGSLVHTPYYTLGLDALGNARLLRARAAVQQRMAATNVASYAGCEADAWLENAQTGFLSRFDAATLTALQNTQISYVDYNQSGNGSAQVLTIARRCFLLSYSEEGFGDDPAGSEGQSCLAALKTATGQTGDNAARIVYNDIGVAVSAWTRSAGSANYFRYVSTSGGALSGRATVTADWLRPVISVLPTTPVSEEGAEAIFLLPDGRRTYWAIDASMSLGVTESRPKSCKLMIPHGSFTVLTAQVCNNYRDLNPTWINCGDDQTVVFGTSKTAADWELGVKIHAEAPAADRSIGEPAMIVAFGV